MKKDGLNDDKPMMISLFSGCGGIDLGFKQAGYDISYAVDFNKDACDTYRVNLGDQIQL